MNSGSIVFSVGANPKMTSTITLWGSAQWLDGGKRIIAVQPGESNLAVMKSSGQGLSTISLPDEARFVAVDPAMKRVYVSMFRGVTIIPLEGPSSRSVCADSANAGEIACSPNGRCVAIAGLGWLGIWNASGGWPEWKTRLPTQSLPSCLSISDDNSRVYSVVDGQIEVRNISNGLKAATHSGQLNNVLSLSYAPDRPTYYVLKKSGVMIWPGDGEPVAIAIQFGRSTPYMVSASHDGKSLAIACSDGKLRIFDISTSRLTKIFGLPGPVANMTFSDKGDLLVCYRLKPEF